MAIQLCLLGSCFPFEQWFSKERSNFNSIANLKLANKKHSSTRIWFPWRHVMKYRATDLTVPMFEIVDERMSRKLFEGSRGGNEKRRGAKKILPCNSSQFY
jgi:hypothetical protein